MSLVQQLPAAAPARVLAFGAWLKNSACLLDGDEVHWSPLHGDLDTPQACEALQASAQTLIDRAGGRIDAVAHDLHPDFESTRLALAWADHLDVPALAVQHHHAHLGVLQAQLGSAEPAIGLALDGVGLGSDGAAWGGELLRVDAASFVRVAHLSPLALPGGDVAAREPWRMAAAALHAMGRGDEIVPRLAPAVGERLAAGVASMLARGLHCPGTTSAGRWFDAVAGLLRLSVRQQAEAEAAISLERRAAAWLDLHEAQTFAPRGMDLGPLAEGCVALADAGSVDAAAALFHVGLADGLAQAAIDAARAAGTACVLLGGGCFHNQVLTRRLVQQLQLGGLQAGLAAGRGPGDAALALGQAWIAAQRVAAGDGCRSKEMPACA